VARLARHVSREPRPADRGRGLGVAHGAAVRATVAVYRRLLREAAGVGDLLAAGERVAPHVPGDVVAELEGMAAGAGVDVRELLAVNARTELLGGGAGECSLAARVAAGEAWLAQTWDWHPALAASVIAWTIRLPGGAWLLTVTEAGIVGKLGVSSSGLAVGLNFLTCSADGGLDGVPVHVLARRVLETCATAAGARALLGAARTAASSCLTVAAPGDLFAAELSPGGTRIVEPDPDGRLIHTNHFLTPPPRGTDVQPAAGTFARRAQLARRLRAGVPPASALSEHAPAEEPVCRHGDAPGTPWAERRATLLALIAEPAIPALRVAYGHPCRTPFEPLCGVAPDGGLS
jgi:isopenicillin-N N-acyltransferase like protein